MIVCMHSWVEHANERDCHCAFVKCQHCGVVKKSSRCAFHEAHSQEKRPGRDYYLDPEMGAFDDGIPQNTTFALELATALVDMGAPEFARGSSVVEIGCGIGRLVPWFLSAGMHYRAVEADPWACRYVYDAYRVPATPQTWEAVTVEPRSVDVVACVHTLEHLAEADAAFAKMVMATRRYVLLVVPEGWDIWNPDHCWMFTADVLRVWARNMALHLYGPVQKRVAKNEDTIYALFERKMAWHFLRRSISRRRRHREAP
jgi:hypothetical protein